MTTATATTATTAPTTTAPHPAPRIHPAASLQRLRELVRERAEELAALTDLDEVGRRARVLVDALAPVLPTAPSGGAQVLDPTTVALREVQLLQRRLARVESPSAAQVAASLRRLETGLVIV